MNYHRLLALWVAAVLLAVLGCQGVVAQTAPPLVPPAAPAGPLTVEDAVAFALRNNPSVTFAQENVNIARAQVGIAKSNKLPNVSFVISNLYTPAPTSISIPGAGGGTQTFAFTQEFATTALISVSQPVWPATRWQAPISVANANVASNEDNLKRTQQQVTFQTQQAFFQVLGAQELLQVANTSVDVAQSQLDLAKATVAAGLAAKLDEIQAEATLANAQVSLTRAQNILDQTRDNLATQLGLPAGTPVEISAPGTLPLAPEQVDPLVQQALASRPEMLQLGALRQRLRANIDIIKLEQRPLVDLAANYQQDLSGNTSITTNGLNFGATIAMNLYNGGRTKAELSAARQQLQQVDTTAQQLELSITQEVRQAWLNLQSAVAQLDAATKQYTASREAWRIAGIRYANGEGILLEVNQARLTLIEAETSLTRAHFEAQTAAAQLEFAVGAPVAFTTIPVESLPPPESYAIPIPNPAPTPNG